MLEKIIEIEIEIERIKKDFGFLLLFVLSSPSPDIQSKPNSHCHNS